MFNRLIALIEAENRCAMLPCFLSMLGGSLFLIYASEVKKLPKSIFTYGAGKASEATFMRDN